MKRAAAWLPVLVVLLVPSTSDSQSSGQGQAIPACTGAVPPTPRDWQEQTLGERFAISLPSTCSVDADARYVHGGQSWTCQSVSAEIVWGMWGPASFGEVASQCTTKVAGREVLVFTRPAGKGQQLIVWYRTASPAGPPHEPIVSVRSARAEDNDLVAAIAFSGRILPAK